MEKQVYQLSRLEQSGFSAAVTIGCGLFFLMAVALQSGRALFIEDGGQPAAKAFSAVVPTLDAVRSQADLSLLNAAGVRSSSAAAGIASATRLRGSSTGRPLLPGTLPSLVPSDPAAEPAGQSGDGASFGGPATGPLGTGSSPPAGGLQPRGLTGTGPTARDLPVPNAGVLTIQDPVSAVPEPATWAMMLLGFFAIGAAMRRRTTSLQQGIGSSS